MVDSISPVIVTMLSYSVLEYLQHINMHYGFSVHHYAPGYLFIRMLHKAEWKGPVDGEEDLHPLSDFSRKGM